MRMLILKVLHLRGWGQKMSGDTGVHVFTLQTSTVGLQTPVPALLEDTRWEGVIHGADDCMPWTSCMAG